MTQNVGSLKTTDLLRALWATLRRWDVVVAITIFFGVTLAPKPTKKAIFRKGTIVHHIETRARRAYHYESGINEALHLDRNVRDKMVEMEVGDCESGCKVYGTPDGFLKVLGHNTSYGCKKTRRVLLDEAAEKVQTW